MKLSILICTLHERRQFLINLYNTLEPQVIDLFTEIEILTCDWDRPASIGSKRNHLLDRAKGEYVCFVDDDDRVSDNYIRLLFEGINKGVDCCSLKGVITENGKNPLIFEHSLKYEEYKTNGDIFEETLTGNHLVYRSEVKYERYPNHLNCIKASIAKQFRFPETNHGEDTDWATQIHKSGLIKTEHYIPEVIYYYDWVQK